ncbi:unnamed protein product, partial [Callosobruchus maculatus]
MRKKKKKKKEKLTTAAIQIEATAQIAKQIATNKKLVVASKVEDTFIHPMYNIPFVSNNDIALLRLEKPILVPHSQYAILPSEPLGDFDYQCSKVVMASPDETNTGGPVLCNAAQYGIIPYDFHCNRPDGASHNCLYTRVDRMLEFIEESMEEYRLSNSAVHLTNCHSLIYATYLFTLPAVIRNVLL